MLAMRWLSDYIIRLKLNKVLKLSRIYELHTIGLYFVLLEEISMCESITLDHERFISLAEMVMRLFSCYTTNETELG